MHGQGRGGSTGYDNAVALPARSDSDELAKENNKSVAALKGQAVFSVAKVRCAARTPAQLTVLRDQCNCHAVRIVAAVWPGRFKATWTLIWGFLCQTLVLPCISSL